tara:strand:+ start:53 stop:706 length:654 start_codon:yes stop_codon:yes gene_type:complete
MINKKLKYLIILSFFLLPTYNPKVELEFFPIKKIEVSTGKNISKKEITKELSILYETNLMALNIEKINSLIINYELIETASLKKVYPDKIIIEIKEREIIAIVNNNKDKFFISRDNKLLKFNNDIANDKLPNVFGDYKKFVKFYEDLGFLNFNLNNIKAYYYFEVGRWDILTKNKKLIKLPTLDYEKSITNYLNLDNNLIKNHSVFDYRIKDQLILK